MKISVVQFLNSNHSWGLVGQALIKEFLNQNHQCDLISTNGSDKLPGFFKPYLERSCESQKDLIQYLKSKEQQNYDMQLSYTAPINFGLNLSRGNKNRFAIWNYETTVLPTGFAKYHHCIDYLLPSSEFSKQIFLDGKLPEEKLKVIPHGVDVENFSSATPQELATKKSCKILLNIAQPHLRKNLQGSLEAYGRAFNNKDDVVLICKVAKAKKDEDSQFLVNFQDILKKFRIKYPKHAEILVMQEFIPNLANLYAAVDIVYSLNHAECFYLPGLEAFAANKICITSNYGGQLDYMNNQNCFLVDGKIVNAPLNSQYWEASPKAKWFEPNLDQAAQILKECYLNYSKYLEMFKFPMKQMVDKYSWTNAANLLLSLVG